MALEDRKWHILRTIIDDYIATATPVGSRAISKRPDIGLSSATIRNEMSDLEELGYLDQPHTSAGRVPSDKAYRLYVDQMMRKSTLDDADVLSIRQVIDQRFGEVDELIAQTARVLSKLTRYPSAAIAPASNDAVIRHIQLVPVAEGRALAVVITDITTIHEMLMRVPAAFGAPELEHYSRMLTAQLRDHPLQDASRLLEQHLGDELGQHRAFFEQIANAISRNAPKIGRSPIVLGGTANLFMHPEFMNLEQARGMLSVLETEDIMYGLLEPRPQPMQITFTIGAENQRDEMKGASIVTASYRIGPSHTGSFGIIGPTRMEYARVVSVLEYLGRCLSEIFAARLQEGELWNEP